MKTLVIVESPAKAKSINKYLGPDYIVQASFGHIMDLHHSKSNPFGVAISDDFKPIYQINPDKVNIVSKLVSIARTVDNILIASDPDREGEAIAWHLLSQLEKTNKPIKRVEFHEITKKAIQEAIKSPKDLNANMYQAQQARRVLDRFVGFMVSPYLSKSIQPKLSAGRVQSAALKLVTDREHEILDFQPEEYWPLIATFYKNKKETFQAKLTEKLTTKEQAEKVHQELTKATFIVSDLQEKEKKNYPNPPFTTSTLVSSAAGSLKLSAENTIKLAQSLYEAGYITYMRTDSVRSSNEALDAIRSLLSQKYPLPSSPVIYKNKNDTQDAHEAIRPSDVNKLPTAVNLPPDQKSLYKFIWDRFAASQMNPAVYDTASVTIKADKYTFKTSGRMLKSKGYLELLKEENADNSVQLPLLQVNDVLNVDSLKFEQKFTKPASRYSEKTLVEELDKKGIGRPSSLASIMSKICQRMYVENQKTLLCPTPLGMKITEDLDKHFSFVKINYTSQMEEKLDQIAEGKQDYLSMMKEFYPSLQAEVKSAYQNFNTKCGITCSKCQDKMELKSGKNGNFLACISCKFTSSCEVIEGKTVIKARGEVSEEICPTCQTRKMRKIDGKFGPFYSCIAYPECKGTKKIS